MATSTSAQEAVKYLNRSKPLGSWGVESKGGAVRLLRRKISTTDTYFLDIHHDPATDCVVGILSKPKGGKAQGQVLVDQDGKLVGSSKSRIITVSSYDPNSKPASRSSAANSSSGTRTATANTPALNDEQNKQLLRYALYFIGVVTILRLLTQAMFAVSLLLFPAIYLYALQSCPHESSFDAKKELRRILRGHHLPENHQSKPKSWLEKTVARVNAAVTTELATGLGYEVTMMSLGGAAWFTTCRVPTTKSDFYWVGIFDRWIYVYSKQYEE